MGMRELRPNEAPRLAAELETLLREMLSQDPDAVLRILTIVKDVVTPDPVEEPRTRSC